MSKLLPPKQLGPRIKAWRKTKGYEHGKDFAAAIGKDPSELSRYENGKVQPEYDTVVTIARKLGVNVAEFMESGVNSDGPSANDGQPAKAHADGGAVCSELERVCIDEIRRIAALDIPEWQKMLSRDSVSAMMTKVWGVAEARACEARALAVGNGEKAAHRRAKLPRNGASQEVGEQGVDSADREEKRRDGDT